jgi:hypothetical protein
MLSKVTSITTDFGTEVAIPDCPDILHAFLRRLQGVPMELLEGTIDPHSKLFGNAIKMPGWSHMFGNLMHYACKQVDTWPVLLNAIRVLCKFFRNVSWRRTLVSELKHIYPPVVALLKTFKESLKKWRYETIWLCMFALRPLRFLCQIYLTDPFLYFGDGFQDRGGCWPI